MMDDAFSLWINQHPEASRRDAWDAAVRACMRMLSSVCVKDGVPKGCDGAPPVLWTLHSQRHRPFATGGK